MTPSSSAATLHRYYEVRNGNHIERYRQSCCNLVQVERGGTIAADPVGAGRPERCASLLVE